MSVQVLSLSFETEVKRKDGCGVRVGPGSESRPVHHLTDPVPFCLGEIITYGLIWGEYVGEVKGQGERRSAAASETASEQVSDPANQLCSRSHISHPAYTDARVVM